MLPINESGLSLTYGTTSFLFIFCCKVFWSFGGIDLHENMRTAEFLAFSERISLPRKPRIYRPSFGLHFPVYETKPNNKRTKLKKAQTNEAGLCQSIFEWIIGLIVQKNMVRYLTYSLKECGRMFPFREAKGFLNIWILNMNTNRLTYRHQNRIFWSLL